jgi:hypothetical protein
MAAIMCLFEVSEVRLSLPPADLTLHLKPHVWSANPQTQIMRLINHLYSKLLNVGVVCYTAIDNCDMFSSQSEA